MSSPQPARSWRLGCVVAIIALFAQGLVFVLHGGLNADEGFYLAASRSVANGLRPFRDFGFTQTPLVLYANLPWLSLAGFDLTGIRFASLGWAMIAAITGAAVLRGRHGWPAAILFILLLVSSPGWIAWATKGKTYAFSGFAVLLGAIALGTGSTPPGRWAGFILSAILAVAGRLTSVAFFLPAGVILLIWTPGWRGRLLAIGATALMAVATLAVISAGCWERFWFWTSEFHAASTIRPPMAARLAQLLTLAPALWVAVGYALGTGRTHDGWRVRLPLLCLLIAVLGNVMPPSGYAEYAATFVPATAWVAAPLLTTRAQRARIPVRIVIAVASIAVGWVEPPKLSPNVLRHAHDAASFLAASTPADGAVIASMPEIAIAARRTIPPTLIMGKFAVTEDFAPGEAAQRLLLTPMALVEMLADPGTHALVFSSAEKWNFSWSVPNYHYLSRESAARIFAAIQQQYALEFANPDYVIFLRRRPQP